MPEIQNNNPTSVEELRENKEYYQHKIERREEEEGLYMGSVILPREGASEMACQAFHRLMTECGHLGVEYAQEALHGNGDYFDDFFDSVEEVMEDFKRMEEMA